MIRVFPFPLSSLCSGRFRGGSLLFAGLCVSLLSSIVRVRWIFSIVTVAGVAIFIADGQAIAVVAATTGGDGCALRVWVSRSPCSCRSLPCVAFPPLCRIVKAVCAAQRHCAITITRVSINELVAAGITHANSGGFLTRAPRPIELNQPEQIPKTQQPKPNRTRNRTRNVLNEKQTQSKINRSHSQFALA